MAKTDPRKKAATRKKVSGKLVSIRGVVTGSRWDKKFNVVGVSLSSVDEREYLVDNTGKGRELLAHIMEHIEVKGILREDEEGRWVIGVKSYQCIHLPSGNEL